MEKKRNAPGGQAWGAQEGAETAENHLNHNKKCGALQVKKLNRRQAIRARCFDCSGFDKTEIRECPITDCPLYQFRMTTGKQDPKARDRAIRAYCLFCMNNQRKEVTLCPSGDCPLYPYRQTSAAMQKKRRIGETFHDKIPAKGLR